MLKALLPLCAILAVSQAAKDYPIRLQPELDSVDVEAYIKNERLLNFQLKCLFDESPCDIVGRWLKPRVAPVLLGECPKCTPVQEKKIERVVNYMSSEKPVIFRALFVKFILDQGINVDEKEKEALAVGLSETSATEIPENAAIKEALLKQEADELSNIPTEAPVVTKSEEARRRRRFV